MTILNALKLHTVSRRPWKSRILEATAMMAVVLRATISTGYD